MGLITFSRQTYTSPLLLNKGYWLKLHIECFPSLTLILYDLNIQNKLNRFIETWLSLSSSSPEDVPRKAPTLPGQSLETKAHSQSMPIESSRVKTGGISRQTLMEAELVNKSKDGQPGEVWKRKFLKLKIQSIKVFVLFSGLSIGTYICFRKQCNLIFTNAKKSKRIKNPEKVTKQNFSFLDILNIRASTHFRRISKCL